MAVEFGMAFSIAIAVDALGYGNADEASARE